MLAKISFFVSVTRTHSLFLTLSCHSYRKSRSHDRTIARQTCVLLLSLSLSLSVIRLSFYFFIVLLSFCLFFLFFFLCFRSLYDRSQDVTNFLIDSACTFVQLTVTQSLLNDRIGEKKGKVMERLASLYRTLNFPVDLRNRLQRKQSKRRIPVIINSVN